MSDTGGDDADFAAALAGAQAGDERAFTIVYRRMQPAVLRYLRVLAGPTAAEDLAAETWIAALRNLTSFSGGPGAFRAWLLTIARARWVDAVRSQTRRPELVTDTMPERGTGDDVHATVERVVTTEAALALIATLPPDQAEAVTLRVIGELEVAEAAEVMGKTTNHVRVLTHRGLKRLAQALSAQSGRVL